VLVRALADHLADLILADPSDSGTFLQNLKTLPGALKHIKLLYKQ
jgi:hypothetical protein